MNEQEPTTPTRDSDATQQRSGVGLKAVLSSVFAAALGVQSSKNRERDFKQGSAGAFFIAGLIFTVLFVGGVITVVQLVIANQ